MAGQLNSQQVEALLDRLSTDDGFRKLFTSNLGEALAQLPGNPGVPDGIKAGCCLQPVELADKATIAKSREQIFKSLVAMQPHIPKILEAR